MNLFFWNEMSWDKVKKVALSKAIVIFPIGAIEQHGFHLPLDVDSRIPFEVAKRVAERLSSRINVIIAPPLSYGSSSHHMDFPGTLSLTTQTLIRVVEEICNCIISHGFQKILILNGHGGNIDPLKVAVRSIMDTSKAFVILGSYWDFCSKELSKLRESPVGGMAHAGELETSCMLALYPNLVDKSKYTKCIPIWKTKYITLDLTESTRVNLGPYCPRDISATGTIGDPTVATRQKGEKFLDIIVNAFADFLIDFSSWEYGKMHKT